MKLHITHLSLLVSLPLFVGAFVPSPISHSRWSPALDAAQDSSSSNQEKESTFDQNILTNEEENTSRRKFFQNAGGVSLALLLSATSSTQPAKAESTITTSSSSTTPKTIVMTGCNSGIGLEACKRLAAEGHTIVLGCRTLSKAESTASALAEYCTSQTTLIPAECDLASQASIQNFAKSVVPNLLTNAKKIDALCLNAGLCRNTAATDCERTQDGFELTVGTNHFGHFYLNHLLLPSMAPDGKIVVTASGVHDPASPGGKQGVPATLGNLQGLETLGKDCEMIDGGAFNADKAYKDSKLCNVLFTRELQRRLESSDSTKGIAVNCFNPGLIVGTGFFRNQNPLFTKVFDFAATDLFKVGETPEWGGGCLAYMVDTVQDRGQFYSSDPGSCKYGDAGYGTKFVSFPISVEAQDDNKARRLWELSEKSLGIA